MHHGAAIAAEPVGGLLEVCRQEVKAGFPDAVVLGVMNGTAPDRRFFERIEAACAPGTMASSTDPPALEGGIAIAASDGYAALAREADEAEGEEGELQGRSLAVPTLASLQSKLQVAKVDSPPTARSRFLARAKKAAASGGSAASASGSEVRAEATSSHKTRSGVAAAVIGGLAVLALVAATVAWVLRRRNLRSLTSEQPQTPQRLAPLAQRPAQGRPSLSAPGTGPTT